MTYLLHSLVWSAVWGALGGVSVSAYIDYRRNKNQGSNRHGR